MCVLGREILPLDIPPADDYVWVEIYEKRAFCGYENWVLSYENTAEAVI